MAQPSGSERVVGAGGPLAPADRAEARPSSGAGPRRAAIGAGTAVRGQVAAREDLWIDGLLEGEAQAPTHQIVVGPAGRVRGELRARSVVVEGELIGDLRADQQATVRAGARMVGDIRSPRVVLEEGCHYTGRIDMVPEGARAETTAAAAAATEPDAARFPADGARAAGARP
jgi:cytoskeletal protein CcmA (bactofilin family)